MPSVLLKLSVLLKHLSVLHPTLKLALTPPRSLMAHLLAPVEIPNSEVLKWQLARSRHTASDRVMAMVGRVMKSQVSFREACLLVR